MNIAIFPNLNKKNAKRCTQEVCQILQQYAVSIYLDEQYSEFISNKKNMVFGKFESFFSECDVIIVIGGDGTIIQCTQIVSSSNIPLLAINSGRLGFMASLEENELKFLKNIVTGDYSIASRMMLKGKLVKKSGETKYFSALNDIVVSKGNLCKLVDFKVMTKGQVISSLRADGLIFSTPTGSTAYSLSAGGPIIDPTVECIEFTQICPFSLLARTMIFSPDKIIKVTYSTNNNSCIIVSNDGCGEVEFLPDDELYIYKSDEYVKFIDINGGNFYQSVNTKLMQPLKGNVELEEIEK